MKQFIQSCIILTFFLNVFQLGAQEASRFPIQKTSVWHINYEYRCEGFEYTHESGDQEYKYFINGDTLIADRTYFKLYKTGILYLEKPIEVKNKYMGAIRESANRVYFVKERTSAEHMIYNFDAKVGEPLCSECDGPDYIVGDIVTLDNGRKKFYIDVITVHCGSANALIEGIGWLGGFLEGNACYAHPGVRGSYLLCYSENGSPVYNTEESPRCGKKMVCDGEITSINQPALTLSVPEITLLNNRSLEICFLDGTTGLYDIEIYSILGQKLKQLTLEMPGSVDVSSLGSGTFLVKISNGQRGSSSKFMIR